MRIADDRTFCEPILGNEYLLQKKKRYQIKSYQKDKVIKKLGN